MTIYATPFDPETMRCTANSMPCGKETFFDVMASLGTPLRSATRMLVYAGWAYTDFVLHSGPGSIDRRDK